MLDSINTPILCKQVPRIGNKFSQWLGTAVLKSMGWSYSGTFPCCSKMIIGVAPHTSNWDFVLGLAVAFNLRLKISFFGKHSLFIPPFSRLLRRCGGIPIERNTKHGVVDGMADKMRDAKSMVLCLAPEGTRSPVSPWKTGFLHIAHKSNVPVFLVAFDYKKKLIEFGPIHNIGDNIQYELNRIYLHFKQVQGKYPEKMITKIIPPVEREIER
ncbi:MAG: 1-acyl-sn-glycerol-3-phosphate acyltransferase [Paraglaciecola sp.]|jgi:1-acyl-sn-glycerol-3-phosphate acyltransferase|uniref:1-acyl-sn-glycerol-3-phosphate acyltransferase n=1 Tax=uncultured Paraglaciecola sp. TaxID=1765024 RepID=UPI0025FD6B3D|nr:1-acyl-sn-glycerol-3-phosphate acyltransferase [uncultured Paraglaciecola sp.]